MAYKFQRGKANLSGSITAEEGLGGTLALKDLDIDGATDIGEDLVDADLLAVDNGAGGTNRKTTLTRMKKYIFSALSGDATASDAGALTIAANAVEGSMLNSNVAGAGISYGSNVVSVNANPDSFSVSDGDGLSLSSSVAGAGLALAGGALSLDIDELAALGGTGLHQTQDHFVFSDNGTEKKITFSNLEDAIFANVSGDATVAAGGALTIAAGAVETAMIADNQVTLAKMAGLARGKIIYGDASGDPAALAAGANGKLLIADDNGDLSWTTVSGDITFSAGAATIGANAVEDSMVNDNVATGLAGDGLSAASGVMAVAVSGAIAINSDKLGIPKSVFGAGLKPNGPTNFTNDVKLNVSPDSFGLADGDGLFLSSSVAGAGIALTAGVLSVDIDELAALGGTGLHQTQDHFIFSDNGTEKKITFSNLQDAVFADVSGDATIAAGGALTIGAGAVEGSMLNDNIISGQGALGSATVAQADLLMIDDGPGTVKKVTFSNFEDSIFGNVSGDATIAAGGALTIAAGSVENGMLAGSIANGKLANSAITIAGTSVSLGGAITAFAGITDLDAAASDLTIFDTQNNGNTLTIGHSNGKVKIAGDLTVVGTVEAVSSTQLKIEDALIVCARSASTNANIAGAGLQFGDGSNNAGAALLFKNDATYGQLLDALDGDHSGSIDIRAKSFVGDLIGNVVQDLSANAASTALIELKSGINTFSSASIPQSASLPATPETGSVIHVKADESCDSVRFVKIQSHANHSQKIDGDDYIVLESPYAGLSLMYVGKNKWIVL